jgi:two-component system CheB/CheR fusion protein
MSEVRGQKPEVRPGDGETEGRCDLAIGAIGATNVTGWVQLIPLRKHEESHPGESPQGRSVAIGFAWWLDRSIVQFSPMSKLRKNAARSGARAKKPAPPVPSVIVGIGASAGGLEALEEFFRQVPADSPIAFVVVTHQQPGHISVLPEILGKDCRLPVVVAKDGAHLLPGRVCVIPPGVQAGVRRGRLHLTEGTDIEARQQPIDHFLRTLAADQKERSVCVILSGMGSDGTLGLKAVKAEAGMVMVQDVQSAKYAGMPSSAIATGLADYVVAPAAMPAQLVAYVRGPATGVAATATEAVLPDEPLEKILALLRARTRHDFALYKPATIRRRIQRRMNVLQIREPGAYIRHLQRHPDELDRLFRELLISVTEFFRDPDAWRVLVDKVLPERLQALTEPATVRVWVPGCATGEEAYSVAIALRESMERLGRRFDAKVFASDLDSQAIEAARLGVYPLGIAADVPPPWLARYFTREDHHYRIGREIRNLVIFAPQNVISDPPFTRLDLISCRNLFIYLNNELQHRLLPVFHHALKPGGLLFMGASESIGDRSELFGTVDRQWKIYARKETAGGPTTTRRPASLAVARSPAAPHAPLRPAQAIPQLIEQQLLSRFAPTSALVNARGDIVHLQGRTGLFLAAEPAGMTTINLLELARDGLQAALRTALQQAAARRVEVVHENIPVEYEGAPVQVSLTVIPMVEPEAVRGLFLVLLQPAPVVDGRAAGRRRGADQPPKLARGLQEARASLQATVGHLATRNEELKAANEELQSTNEELQSTNEELETSREELQSLNEELTTVNAEQHASVDELARARDDMQNLLNSTEVATVFLDNQLRIRRFTESATKIIHLIPTDAGRPLSDQTSKLKYDRLVEDCREVLKTLQPRQVEVATKDGIWYQLRILPYRTIDNAIDGVVMTFVNTTEVTLAEKAGREARAYFENIFNTVREPLVVLDTELRLVSANQAFYTRFRWRPRQVEGELIYEIGNGEWNQPELRRLLEKMLTREEAVDDFRLEADFAKIGHRVFVLNARRLPRQTGLPGLILLAMQEAPGN